MPDLPDFVWLAATDDHGVALVCDEPACAPVSQYDAVTWGEVAYYGGTGDDTGGRPHFELRQLGAFIDFIHQHIDSHKGPS